MQAELAQQVVLDRERFLSVLDGDAAKNAFMADQEGILSFVRKYHKVAPREVEEVFSLGQGDAVDRLQRFVTDGLLTKQAAGNGYFFLG